MSAPGAGWFPDPLGRHPLRYWDGAGWSTYVWRGQVWLDPLGLQPTPQRPPWTSRVRSVFRTSPRDLLMVAAFLAGAAAITFLGASPSAVGDVLLLWVLVLVMLLACLADRARWLYWTLFGINLVGALVLALASAGYELDSLSLVDPNALTFGAAALAIGGLQVPHVRRLIARVIRIDPARATHTMALQFLVLVAASWVLAQTDGHALDASQYSAYNFWDSPASELPFLAAGVAGVGLLVRRNLGEAAARLGLVRPTFAQVCVAIAVAEGLLVLSGLADFLTQTLTPSTSHELDQVGQTLYSSLGTNFLPWLVLGISAGVAEEVLMRGALQPRFGLILTSLAFASLHVQYGISFVLALIVLTGLVLGLLRTRANTTTAIVCHATYDLLSGWVFPTQWFLVGLALQALIFGFLLWRRRRAIAAFRGLTGRRRPVAAAPPLPSTV